MIHRNQALVGYIWFCLELDNYDCTKCAPTKNCEEAFSISDTDHCPITTAFQILFSTLSTWKLNGDLILDISIYSPSDSEHWFKYLTFMPDTLDSGGTKQVILDKASHDPQHGWVAGFQHSAPSSAAIRKVFHSVMDEGPFDSEQLEIQWWDQLPSVPAVTSLLLRQQNRRRWKPDSLAHMFARFPRLQEVHYEPWREWDVMHINTDLSEYCCIPARFVACSHLYSCPIANNPHPLTRVPICFRVYPMFQQQSQETCGLREL